MFYTSVHRYSLIIRSVFLIADNNEKDVSETKSSNGKINEHNKQNSQQRRNESQKNLLIDLSNDPKPAGNSWVSDEMREFFSLPFSLCHVVVVAGPLKGA